MFISMDNGASSYRRFLDGDETAFDDILNAYRDSLTFFINRYVNDISAAEDIAIDCFMELVVHRRRYNFKTSLKTYLFMLGRSRAIDYIRRRQRMKTSSLSDLSEQELADSAELEEAVLAGERQRVVSEALDKLPDDMAAAVHLVYFEGLSYEEAAAVMKKKRKQIDNLLYRAKAQLRSIIGKEGELLI